MECAVLKSGILVGIGETNYPDCSWMVATPVTDKKPDRLYLETWPYFFL